MADVQWVDLVRAYGNMDQVSDILFVIDKVCDADIMPLSGSMRDALRTLAGIGIEKLDKVRVDLNRASGGLLD